MIDENLLKGNIFCIANVDAKKVLDSLEGEEENGSKECNNRKRKRLDDFTPQEKMIRRKLKNRVAAQNARDRKKERLEQLESIVGRLESENKQLKKSNEELKIAMNKLCEQNKLMQIKLGMNSTNIKSERKSKDEIIITPTVIDHDHIVIKKEEDTEPEYAAESSDSSCFIDHDLVSKSSTGQLLLFLEQLETGTCGEINVTKEINPEKTGCDEVWINQKVDENELSADNTGMSSKETEELFSLCKDIQDLVDGSNHAIDISETYNSELSSLKKLMEFVPDEVTNQNVSKSVSEICPSPTPSIAEHVLEESINISFENFSDDDSAFEEDLSSIPGKSKHSSWEDDFLDLFPTLA